MKTLVLYVFHEYTDLVDNFIKKGIFYDDNVDFVVISNDKNREFDVPYYVKKIARDNTGFDFGGWSEALLSNNLYKEYDHFICVNSSVLGPFVPDYYKGKWTDIYVNELQENTKLFGSTINTLGDPINQSHIQSYIFAMDKTTLEYLIECEIFSISNYAVTYHDAIWKKEVLMSRKIIEKGWNIGSLFPLYKNVDFTFSDKKPEDYDIVFLEDVMWVHNNLTHVWNEYQLVFIKGNRGVHK